MNFTYLDQYLDSLLDFGFPMYDCIVHVRHEEVYRRRGDTLSHAGTCAYLSEAVTAIKEVHRFRWWNLL